MKTGQSPDKNLLTVILVLITFGWIMSFSASLGSQEVYWYFFKQTFFIVLGLGAGLWVLKKPISFFKDISPFFYGVTLILLILVFVPIIGHSAGGATRWINFVLFKFQPSEMMKLAMILFMAGFLIRQKEDIRKPWSGLLKTLVIVAIPSILLLFETDLGATIIIASTALIMLFAAGVYLTQLAIIGSGLISLTGIGLYIDGLYGGIRWQRLTEFWQTELWFNNSTKVDQTKQALIGIARGDWTGTGLGAGLQKYIKLSEAHTDMIFSIIGEELGIIGMLFVLSSFAYILGKGFNIAKESLKNGRKYSSYVAFGICTWFSMQISVNIAMNLGLIPIKGFTLPLISYGGSSMVFTIIALALLLRIDMENRAGYDKQKHFV
ncbi:putative peptidoglycan glycosyltransferase FtsW [Candidatus Thioglobus sp.]|jgi:Bacterial cell division membrane protein|uniref:FtsW/RodA/SpoVE family cell cycle protein n=1 Tax=Candidatus Thioglobus sp. TaxID=2026721 RepID=UPI003242B17E